jgi:hypothetical protein
VVNGRDVKDVAASWSGDTSVVVARAVAGLGGHSVAAFGNGGNSGGVVRF